MRTDQHHETHTNGDRRRAARHACTEAIPLWTLGKGHVEAHWASVEDISPIGVRLQLHYPFEPGVALAMNLRCRPDGPTRMAVGRVVHLAPGPHEGWTLGCAFDRPLTDEAFVDLQQGAEEDEEEVTVCLD